LKQHTWVSSRLQIHPSLTFNDGIRVERFEYRTAPGRVDEDEGPAGFGGGSTVEIELFGEGVGAADREKHRPSAGADSLDGGENLRIVRHRKGF
jgi:hypothetical protein